MVLDRYFSKNSVSPKRRTVFDPTPNTADIAYADMRQERRKKRETERITQLFRENKPEQALTVWRGLLARGMNPDARLANSVLDGMVRHKLLEEALKLLQRMRRQWRHCLTSVSWNIVLRGLIDQDRLPEAGQLLEQARREHFRPDAITHTALLKGLVRSGGVSAARPYFETLLQRGEANAVHYAVMIGALTEEHAEDQIEALLQDMRARGIAMHTHVYQALLHAYGTTGRLEQAQRVWDELRASGLPCATSLWNCMITAYGRAGRIDDALRLLSQMRQSNQEPDHVTYGALVDAFARAQLPDRAVEAVEDMRFRRIQPNEIILSTLLVALIPTRLALVERYWNELLALGPRVDISWRRRVFLHLLECRTPAAVRLAARLERLARACRPPIPIHLHAREALVTAAARVAEYDLALQIFEELLDEIQASSSSSASSTSFSASSSSSSSSSPSSAPLSFEATAPESSADAQVVSVAGRLPQYVVVSAIAAALYGHGMERAQRYLRLHDVSGFKPNEAVLNLVVEGLLRSGRVEEARHIFTHEFPRLGVRRTHFSYTPLLKHAEQHGDLHAAQCIYAHMLSQGITPNTFTLTLMMDTARRIGRLTLVEYYFGEIERRGLDPDRFAYSSYLDALLHPRSPLATGAASSAQSTTALLADLEGAKPDPQAAALAAMEEPLVPLEERCRRAELLLADMRARGIRLSIHVYNIVLRGFERAGQEAPHWARRVLEIYEEMRKNNDTVVPDEASYNAVLRAMARLQELSLVPAVWHEMQARGCRASPTTLNWLMQACALQGNMRSLDLYARELERMGLPADTLTYETLVRTYACQRHWRRVEQLLRELASSANSFPMSMYGVILQAYRHHDLADRAALLLREMRRRGFPLPELPELRDWPELQALIAQEPPPAPPASPLELEHPAITLARTLPTFVSSDLPSSSSSTSNPSVQPETH